MDIFNFYNKIDILALVSAEGIYITIHDKYKKLRALIIMTNHMIFSEETLDWKLCDYLSDNLEILLEDKERLDKIMFFIDLCTIVHRRIDNYEYSQEFSIVKQRKLKEMLDVPPTIYSRCTASCQNYKRL